MGDPKAATPLVRARRSLWALAAYLIAFAVLINAVTDYFLLPGLDAARDADRAGRQQLSAVSVLLLTVILVVCLMGLILVFRLGRFFFPRSQTPAREKTQHIDAWAESAKRMKTPPRDPADADSEIE